MTHERENTCVPGRFAHVRGSRRVLLAAGLAGVASALAAPAEAQVARTFTGAQGPQWGVAGNWAPFGVPAALDRVTFRQGGGKALLVALPDEAEVAVRTITVGPLTGGQVSYRFDLGAGLLRATAPNVPSLVVGRGDPQSHSSLLLEHGDLGAGMVWVSVYAPGTLTVGAGALLVADDLLVGGASPGLLAIDGGEVRTTSARLAGDVVLAGGAITLENGRLHVDGTLRVGIDHSGAARASTLSVGDLSFAIVGAMAVGPGSQVVTDVLVLDPALRGLSPMLGVAGGFDLSSGAQFEISDALIQRSGATLGLRDFAGVSPFTPIDGVAELAGTFVLTFAPAFEPALGSQFVLISTQGGVQGRWTVSFLPGLTGGRFLTIDYPPAAVAPGDVVLGVDDLDQILDFDDPEDGVEIPPGPTAAVMGDFNNDGRPDVAIALADPDEPLTAPGAVAILLNRGVDETGWLGFESQILLTVIADPRSIDVADFDLDGNLDLIVVGHTPQAAQVIQNLGTTYDVLAPIALPSGAVDVRTADFNGDGRPDAVCALPDIQSVVELRNELRAWGLVPRSPEEVGLIVEAVDPFDPDQDKDSDLGGGGGASGRGIAGRAFVALNDGEGGFGPSAITDVGDSPVNVASGDFDGDGFPEFVTVDFGSDTVSILVNDGTGQFSQAFGLPVGGSPRSITINDLDGDGDLDIAIVADTANGRALQVIRNDTLSVGDLVFAPVLDVFAGSEPTIVLSADLNGDARVDLVAINPSGPRGVGGQVTAVLSKSSPRCAADFTRDGVVNQTDLDAFLAAWFRDLEQGSYIADFNRDSVVNSTDVSDFVNEYLNAPAECLG